MKSCQIIILIAGEIILDYIPQSVYLFDGNVAQNVAFGLDIDEEEVIESLKKS